MDYSARTAVLTVTMADGTANDGLSGEADNIGADIENLDCGTGNDIITGNDLANVINGGAGDDTISGGAGNDTLSGNADDDTLNGEAGDDYVDGDADVNTIDCGGQGGDIGANAGAGGSITGCQFM